MSKTTIPNIIVGEYGIYDAVPYSKDIKEFKDNRAYIKGDFYYLFRGFYRKKSVLPGIYIDMHTDKHIFIEPTSVEECETYLVRTHIPEISNEDMIRILKERPEEDIIINDVSNSFLPDITRNDDPLKRAVKEALLVKNVNIDSCKSRFVDRNALFNFKSVLKSDGRLSALLFERGLDALNLDYHIVLTERDPNFSVGQSLNDPESMKRLNVIRDKYGIIPSEIEQQCGHIMVSNIDKYKLQGEVS